MKSERKGWNVRRAPRASGRVGQEATTSITTAEYIIYKEHNTVQYLELLMLCKWAIQQHKATCFTLKATLKIKAGNMHKMKVIHGKNANFWNPNTHNNLCNRLSSGKKRSSLQCFWRYSFHLDFIQSLWKLRVTSL